MVNKMGPITEGYQLRTGIWSSYLMNTLYNIYKFISCDQVLHDNVLKIGKRYVCDIVRTFDFVYNIYIYIIYPMR